MKFPCAVMVAAFTLGFCACMSEDPYNPADTGGADTTPPAIVGDVSVSPAVLKMGDIAVVSFEVSRELSKDPVITLKAGAGRTLTIDATRSKGLDYVFTYTAKGDEPEGIACNISIVMTYTVDGGSGDLTADGGSVIFDFTPPVAAGITVTGSPVKAGGTVKVMFASDENLSTDPVVKLGDVVMDKDASSYGLSYVYTHVAAAADGSGDKALIISLVDLAGNTASLAPGQIAAFDVGN